MAGFKGLLDMIDGGGAGASGRRFEGGPISGLLNQLGIRPMGYRDRMEAMQSTRPQLRPQAPAQVSTQSQPMQYSGRGNAGMPSRPIQGSGMTPANAYVGMTQGQPIQQAQMPPQAGPQAMTQAPQQPKAPSAPQFTPESAYNTMRAAYPDLDDDQLEQMTMQYLRNLGAM